jgi:putative transposase
MNNNSQKPAEMSEAGRALECGDLSPLSTAADLSAANTGSSSHVDLFKKVWPHAPVHKLTEQGVYFVTAGTLHKERLFTDAPRLDLLESKLLELANQYHWQIEAWAVFANHYHFVARGFPDSANLGRYLKHLHADTARALNRLDGKAGRQVWHNFRDSRLTFEKSYLARLNYVHQNAVKHRLVRVANQYPWCSATWFERVAAPAMVQTIYSFKTNQVNVQDDF